MTTGYQLRLEGIEANLAAASAVNRTYREHAETALAGLACSGRTFTADDVRAAIPAGVEAHHPNVLPSLLGSWASLGRIRRVGEYVSRRPSRHASRNRVYVGRILAHDAT